MKDFAELSVPLHRFAGKNVQFLWDTGYQVAFDRLKLASVTSSVLAIPTELDPFILASDASH